MENTDIPDIPENTPLIEPEKPKTPEQPAEGQPAEPEKKDGRGRPKKQAGLSYQKTGNYAVKFFDKVKQAQKGEGLDKEVKKDWVKSFDELCKANDAKVLSNNPWLNFGLCTVELIIDALDLEKIADRFMTRFEKKKNDKKPVQDAKQ